MRDIIFRGKARYGDYWAEGVYINESNILPKTGDDAITVGGEILNKVIEVIPKTVGQYTGLKDKNGKMIFEGDVVRIEDFVNATVKWREDIACWTLQSYIVGNTWGSSMLEVIGNIHDQKEDV